MFEIYIIQQYYLYHMNIYNRYEYIRLVVFLIIDFRDDIHVLLALNHSISATGREE